MNSEKTVSISPELRTFLGQDARHDASSTARKIGVSADTLFAVIQTGKATERVAKACETYRVRVGMFAKPIPPRQAARRGMMDAILGSMLSR